jgi:hypothetical protein
MESGRPQKRQKSANLLWVFCDFIFKRLFLYYLPPFSAAAHTFCGRTYSHKKKGEAEINSINTLRRHVFGFSSMISTPYTLYFFHSKLAPIFRANYRAMNFWLISAVFVGFHFP